MGRWPGSGKTTVEGCISISISWLRQTNCLSGEKIFTVSWSADGQKVFIAVIGTVINEESPIRNRMVLCYDLIDRYTGQKENLRYEILIDSTACNFGGVRYWFICGECRNRVGKLYLAPGRKYFDCRNCCNLTYRSCLEHDKRVNALAKDPERIADMMKAGGKGLSLALKAMLKFFGKD